MAVELARILRLPPGAVSAEAPLAGLGLDSLGGMELRTALEQRLGMPVPLTGIAEGLNLEILARRIAAQMQTGQAEAEQGEAGAAALLALHEPRPAAGFEDAA
jgi:acyl carrier protein